MVNLVNSTNDAYEQYARHCLKLAAQTSERNARLLLREMAAEWLRLTQTSALATGFDGFNHDSAEARQPPASSPNAP
jgi:hypothetical protein